MSKRVIITGAAGGLGAAATEELRRQGATVVGLDLKGNGDDILDCDVRDQASVDAAVAAAIEKLGGGVDVVINNAGVGDPAERRRAPGRGRAGPDRHQPDGRLAGHVGRA